MAVVAPVIAVIGGGQLARMMAPAAESLGIHLRVLVESPQAGAAAAVVDTPVGAAADAGAVIDLVATEPVAQVLTFEHEHVPGELLATVAQRGVPVRPGPAALLFAQDKGAMRARLTTLDVPCPPWQLLPRDPREAHDALAAFVAGHGGRAVLKTARGGYDGKGVRVIDDAAAATDWLDAAASGGPELVVEQLVPFSREVAVLVARRPSGEVRAWPVVESIQVNGVCSEVIAPAPGLTAEEAAAAVDLATRIAVGLDVTGVLAVEMFEVPDGPERFIVNELAMRPHNCGHWTIDGAVTSQFEQHLRAVLDLPLGDTTPTGRWTVMANVLGSARAELTDGLAEVFEADRAAKVTLYGKEARPGRKLGHVNVSGDDLDDVRRRARAAAAIVRGDHDDEENR